MDDLYDRPKRCHSCSCALVDFEEIDDGLCHECWGAEQERSCYEPEDEDD